MTIMEEFRDIRELLKPRRAIMASGNLRERIDEAISMSKPRITPGTWLWRTSRAAACVAIVLGVAWFVKHQATSSSVNNECIVYADGKQVSDAAARNIAEADVAKMEKFMQTVARQRTEEEAKVNQFMQHKTISR